MNSLEELLAISDILTLHVPDLPSTRHLISAPQLALMKPGSMLINASRGSVVDLDALAASLKSKHLAGAAVDVYPSEPMGNGPGFVSVLQGLNNVILTPHIGGSTVEAQVGIGKEVAQTLVKFFESGATIGAVNVAQVSLNGVNRQQINIVLGDYNIEKQTVESGEGTVSILIADLSVVDGFNLSALLEGLAGVKESISTRIL
jgi:D-3-phosphoglycerate dehydrogenase